MLENVDIQYINTYILRTTDANLYYKLTSEPSAQVS